MLLPLIDVAKIPFPVAHPGVHPEKFVSNILTNILQTNERKFHQTLVTGVVKAKDELITFLRSYRLKVKVIARSNLSCYCGGWMHPHLCFSIEVSPSFYQGRF